MYTYLQHFRLDLEHVISYSNLLLVQSDMDFQMFLIGFCFVGLLCWAVIHVTFWSFAFGPLIYLFFNSQNRVKISDLFFVSILV